MADETSTEAPKALADGGDPKDYTVEQVNDYLATADAAERARVIALEDGEGGKARATVTREWPQEPQEGAQEPTEGQGGAQDTPEGENAPQKGSQAVETTTKALTLADVAATATPHPTGRLGHSPEADRTGRNDKGLSQRNPAVMGRTEG